MSLRKPLSIQDIKRVKQTVIDRGYYYPTSISAWQECQFRYVYDRTYERPKSAAQKMGTDIHTAIRTALGCEEDVCQELFPVTDHLPFAREELAGNITRIIRPRLFATFEAHVTGEWRGIKLAGFIDLLSEWHRGKNVSVAVTDFKTMSKIRADKVTKYVESIQFAWYAYLTNAWVVYCMPILATKEHVSDGNAAYAAGRKYVLEHPTDCVKSFPNPKVSFEEMCATPLLSYDEWIRGNKLPSKTPNKFCQWCSAYADGVCRGE